MYQVKISVFLLVSRNNNYCDHVYYCISHFAGFYVRNFTVTLFVSMKRAKQEPHKQSVIICALLLDLY